MTFVLRDSNKTTLVNNFVDSQQLKLFRNDHTPDPATDTLGDYTEANFSGYSSEAIGFSGSEIEGNKAVRVSGAVAFTHNGGGVSNDIYGWYLVRTTGTDLVRCAHRFSDAPRAMDGIEDCIKLQLTATGADYASQESGEQLFDGQMEEEFDNFWPSLLYVRLYKNDYTPTGAMNISSFTQANFSGYASESFTRPSGSLSGGQVTAQSPVLAFTLSSSTAQTIYGYYLTNSTGVTLYGAEKFASPITLSDPGDFISFRLTLKVRTAYT